MNILQRIVSEQWYPAECRQRVPTAKSVLKTLSKGVHVPTYVRTYIMCTYICTVLACVINACFGLKYSAWVLDIRM